MTTEADPILGCWYRHLDKGQEFYVVAVDEDNNTIEIQNFDGNLGEVDLQEWRQMDLETIEEPENWSGALDIAEIDDLGTEITDTLPDDWNQPASEIHDQEFTLTQLPFDEPLDDWGEGSSLEEPWESQ
jgi:hypothetical protein